MNKQFELLTIICFTANSSTVYGPVLPKTCNKEVCVFGEFNSFMCIEGSLPSGIGDLNNKYWLHCLGFLVLMLIKLEIICIYLPIFLF